MTAIVVNITDTRAALSCLGHLRRARDILRSPDSTESDFRNANYHTEAARRTALAAGLDYDALLDRVASERWSD